MRNKKRMLFYFVLIVLTLFLLKKTFFYYDQYRNNIPNIKIGDVNMDGEINSADYILIRKFIMRSITLTNVQTKLADINNDNKVTSIDYVTIRKLLMSGYNVTPIPATPIPVTPTLVPETTISLNTTNQEIDAGKTFQLVATSNKKVSFISSNSSVASVLDNGLITARHDGTTIITAKTEDGKEAKCTIIVKNGNSHLFGWDQSEADKEFGPILDGLFTGKTTETIKDKNIGVSFEMHFPDMAYVNGKIYAYYITYVTNSGKGGVGLAISEDGINFENKGCVIQPDMPYDKNGAYFAGVWVKNDTFYLVYESNGDEKSSYGSLGNVSLATSKDGINWEKKGIILHRNKTIWSKTNVGTPDLFKNGNTWYLTFHGYNGTDCQIGVAYGTDLNNLTINKNPILPTVSNTLYSGTTGRRDIIYIDGWYYMVYEISTDMANGSFENSRWTHQFARSRDMINWTTIQEPLLIQKNADNSPRNGFGYDGPCWVIIDNHLYVYFRDTNNSTTRAELTLK